MIIEKFKQASAVEIVSIITPILIIIGLVNKVGVYTSNQIDASWIISLFSPIDFIVSNLEVYAYFILSILYLEKVIFSKKGSFLKEVFFANLTLFFMFLAVMINSYILHKSLSFSVNLYINTIIALNGFVMIFCKKNIIRIIGVIVVLFVPYRLGDIQAKKISNNNLPIVELNDHKKWYLLDKYTDKAILINKDGLSNEFKIVEMKDINLIKNNFY